jgi:hypothetical protein
LDPDCLFPGNGTRKRGLLTVDYRINVHMDLQADKSPVVVKGPFSPRVVNPRYRIREQCATQGLNLVKKGKLSYEEPNCI